MMSIERLWAEAGVEPGYRNALYSALCPEPAALTGEGPSLLALADLCCEAAGGDRRHAGRVTLAWQLLYAAAHTLDSVEDGQLKAGVLARFGLSPAVNIATGLMTSANLALNALEDAGVRPETARGIRAHFYQTGLKMCAGQHADLTLSEPALSTCWQTVEAKSAAFFALACLAGAQLATQDAACADGFGEFGRQLGVLVQIGDDVNGLWPEAEGRSDLAAPQKWTLPVVYALTVLSAAERDQLARCLAGATTSTQAETEARRRIIESGAVLYLTIEAERHRCRAESALLTVAPPSAARAQLLALLQRTAVVCQHE